MQKEINLQDFKDKVLEILDVELKNYNSESEMKEREMEK